jgi:glycosyltransferase involved in cell wall biosynthesis
MKKIKVLHSGETTGALSGFGKYGREVLSRLVNNDRLDIAELAGAGCIEDANIGHVKWKWYPCGVRPGHPEFNLYNSNPINHFGAWRFERICLDFKPDHVFTIRDPWNDTFVSTSPFRPFFYFTWMPTVDSYPQQPSWIECFRECDSILTYSDWAIPVLKRQSGGSIKPVCSAYPGVDLNIYKPLNKIEMRNKIGLPEDAFIIGTTMRNQPRKLFAELFKAFRIFLDNYGNTDVGKKAYLYLHTSYPDPAGWDLPELLNEFGISNRVYFSYICNYSRAPLCFQFSGPIAFSPYSNGPTAQVPNVGNGYTEQQLAEIYNCFDLYIQYANCEGLGMGQPEAAACGVVVAATNHTAMADIVEKTGGIALEPAATPRDHQMKADRAAPNNEFTADAIYKFLCLDKKYKEKKSKQARQAAEIYFNWDRTAQIWSDHFENAKLTGLQGHWDAPIQIADFNIPSPPEGLSNLQFVQWCATFVAKQPELAGKHIGLQLLSNLNKPMGIGGNSREQVFDFFRMVGANKIGGERARVGIDPIGIQDFIAFAHSMEKK